MKPDLAKVIDGLKYMWDGEIYDSKELAEKTKQEYEKNNFQTVLIQEENNYLIYTRRVVTDIVVEGNV